MSKIILITGATDGIGLETAKKIVADGHTVLLHGRSSAKLEATKAEVGGLSETYVADLSRMADVEALAKDVAERHDTLDVLINNAGVLKTGDPITPEGLDVRFVVNTYAPYLLAQRLLPLIPTTGRIVNLSSAAQAPVDVDAMRGKGQLDAMGAYSQSKLAITMWSKVMAEELTEGPVVLAVNPGSLLASKMVKEGFGIAGNDLGIGADILMRAALSDEFADASGKYFDNDSGRFANPHADGLNSQKSAEVVAVIEEVLGGIG